MKTKHPSWQTYALFVLSSVSFQYLCILQAAYSHTYVDFSTCSDPIVIISAAYSCRTAFCLDILFDKKCKMQPENVCISANAALTPSRIILFGALIASIDVKHRHDFLRLSPFSSYLAFCVKLAFQIVSNSSNRSNEAHSIKNKSKEHLMFLSPQAWFCTLNRSRQPSATYWPALVNFTVMSPSKRHSSKRNDYQSSPTPFIPFY